MNRRDRTARFRREPTVVATSEQRDRALAASAVAALVSRILTALSSLVSIGLAARALEAPELGVVTVLSALLVYFAFGDFGMGSMVMTQLPRAHALGDVAEMRRIVSSALSAMLIIASAAGVLGVVSVWVLPWQHLLGADDVASSELRITLVAFFIMGAVGIIGTVGSRVLAALQRAALIRVCDSVAAVVSVVLVGVCASVDGPIWVYLIAIFAPYSTTWLLQLAYVMLVHPELRVGLSALDAGTGLRFLREGSSYAVLSFGWVIAYTLDSIVVASVLGAAQAAVFAIAARLFSLVYGTLSLAGQQMWPAMSEALARGDVEWVRRRFRHSLLAVGGVAAASSLVLVAIGPTFTRLWVGEDLVPPLGLFAVLGVWTVYLTMIVQYSYLLMVAQKIWLLAVLGLVVGGVNLLVSILLTREIGLVGPVIGNLVSAASIQLVPMIVLTRRHLRRLLGDVTPAPDHLPHTRGDS